MLSITTEKTQYYARFTDSTTIADENFHDFERRFQEETYKGKTPYVKEEFTFIYENQTDKSCIFFIRDLIKNTVYFTICTKGQSNGIKLSATLN